jgi:hypothetical protein
MARSSYKLVQIQADGHLVGCPGVHSNILATTFHIEGRSSICNLRTRNAVVKEQLIVRSNAHII